MSRPTRGTPAWKEGRYVDRWVIPHLLCGMAGGFSNVYFELSVPMVFAVGLGLMVAWEVFEALVGITEAWSNEVIDVVVGLVGVAIALVISAQLTTPWRVRVFWIGLVIAMTDSGIGWARSLRERREQRKGGRAG